MRIATTLTMTLAGRTKMSKDIKRKTTSDICQLLLHFTTYFPNVSYVNSKRPRMEGCSNKGEKKQGRRQEEKEEETKDGEDGRRERTANGRERKGTKTISSKFLV